MRRLVPILVLLFSHRLLPAAEPLPTGPEVLQVWKAREARIKTARIAWTEKHHFERGSDVGIDTRESTPDGKVFPNEALDFEVKVTAVFDGDKYALFRDGEQWYNQAEAVIPMIHKYTFDGTRYTHVWQFGKPTADLHNEASIHQNENATSVFINELFYQLGLWCRPSQLHFVSEEPYIPDSPQPSTAGERPCVRIVWKHPKGYGSLWYDADPGADCLPRHFQWGPKNITDIDYTQQNGEWVPVGWTRHKLGNDLKTVVKLTRVQVTECEVNIPISASEFDPGIPVGALVQEATGPGSDARQTYIVTSSGKRPVTQEELQRGATYAELAGSASGEAALPVPRSSWQWWHWAAIALAILACPILFRVVRGQS